MRIGFELRGLTAMLHHANEVELTDSLEAWRKDPKNKGISKPGDDRSPAWTWQTYLYHDGAKLAIPSQNLMVCLRQAGSQMILKRQKTYKEISQSGMMIASEFLGFKFGDKGNSLDMAKIVKLRDEPFEHQSDAARDFGFRLFVKRAKIGTSMHVRVRPRFDTWAASGEVLTVAPELTFDAVKQLFQLAGRVGLGDWRPGCKTPGPFGMFEATVKKLD